MVTSNGSDTIVPSLADSHLSRSRLSAGQYALRGLSTDPNLFLQASSCLVSSSSRIGRPAGSGLAEQMLSVLNS
jgi:hypothetical protein